jgi:lipoprotein signal peptidase
LPPNALDDPPKDATGFLWFLRVLAIVAIPLYGMATVVDAWVEALVIALLAAGALGAIAIGIVLRRGRVQFVLVAAVLAVETGLALWASLR